MSAESAQAKAIMERRRRNQGGRKQTRYEAFKVKYRNDLSGFARDCLLWGDDEGLTDYQIEGQKIFVKNRRFSIRGPHGLGKTAFAAIALLWFALTRDGEDWKVLTLASAWRQMTKYFWPEVHKWSRRIRWDVVGRSKFSNKELLLQNLNLSTGSASALASDNPALIEGAHADQILYIFDESKVIIDETWNSTEGAMSTGDAYWLAISTPGEPKGRFYDIHRRKKGYKDWAVMHVTLDMVMKAGRMNEEWAENRKIQWGEESAMYKNRVLGDFAESGEDALIPLAAIERANARWHVLNDANEWGLLDTLIVDVGRGGDSSAYARKHDQAIKSIETDRIKNTMRVTGKVVAVLKSSNANAIIDSIGIGAGVYDRAREVDGGKFSKRVSAFIAGASTDLKDSAGLYGFADKRSAAWWLFREAITAEDSDIALPPDDDLTEELAVPTWHELSRGIIKVEKKADIKKRLKRSTNKADTVIMGFCPAIKPPKKKKLRAIGRRG